MISFTNKQGKPAMTNTRFSRVFNADAAASTPKPSEKQGIEPVRTAEQLLTGDDARKALLNEIQDLAGAPPKQFQTFYQELIGYFAEFVQQLPHYAHPDNTWLDHHLRLAKTALKMREQFLLVNESLHPIVAKQEALWHYVVFSSALLHKIGVLATQYKVALCDERGQFTAQWQPFMGVMNDQGEHYKLQDISTQTQPNTQVLGHLLARQIMPEAGFNWIASHPEALAVWLDTVEGEGGGGFTHQLIALSEKQLLENAQKQQALLDALYDAKQLQALLDATKLTQQQLLALLPPLTGRENADSEMAAAFFAWLKEGIENGSIAVNQENGLVFLSPDGQFLLYPAILENFCAAYPHYGDWVAGYSGANYLGLTPLSGDDRVFAKHFSETPEQSRARQANSWQNRQANAQQQAQQAQTTQQNLMHQNFVDKTNPDATQQNHEKAAQIHQENLVKTGQSLNDQGFMLHPDVFLSEHHRAMRVNARISYNKNQTNPQTTAAQNQKTQIASQQRLERDTQALVKESSAFDSRNQNQQRLEQRQQAIRAQRENLYPQTENRSNRYTFVGYYDGPSGSYSATRR